jgi:glycosidase
MQLGFVLRVLQGGVILFLSLTMGGQSVSAAPLTAENSPFNVNRNASAQSPTDYAGSLEQATYWPSPRSWRGLSLYQVMIDRFYDGDPRNNDGQHGGFNPGDRNGRHGGDFIGLTAKLDYLKLLGVDVIVLSPIFQNGLGSYHGYKPTDFTLLDDRFGTLSEFRAFVAEAHKRGMYVVVDLIVNHLSDLFAFEGYAQGGAPFRMHEGEHRIALPSGRSPYSDFTISNDFDREARHCAVLGIDGRIYRSSGRGTYPASDFHHNGTLADYFDPLQMAFGQLYGGLNDLRLCSTRVQEKILASTRSLLASTDIDGIRLDTPMQVPYEFLEFWTPRVKEYARSLGKDDFFIFGETYASRPLTAAMVGRGKTPEMQGTARTIADQGMMDGGIHYPLYETILAPALFEDRLERLGLLSELTKLDTQQFDGGGATTADQAQSARMVTFFNNHDQRRLASIVHGAEKTRLATVLISFWPGIPMYYYGDEQGFSTLGSALSGHGREPMMASFGWDRYPTRVRPQRANQDNFDPTSSEFRFTRKVLALRREVADLLQDSSFEQLGKEIPGVFGFQRRSGDGTRWVTVILNFSEKPQCVPVPPSAGERREYLSGRIVEGPCYTVAAREPAIVIPKTVTVPTGLELTAIEPGHDAVLSPGPSAISLQFSEAIDPQVEVLLQLKQNDGISVVPLRFSKDRTTGTVVHELTPGIVEILLPASTRTVTGLLLGSLPALRLRVAPQESPPRAVGPFLQPDLIDQGALSTTQSRVRLSHSFPGAAWFRVITEGDFAWSPWAPYQEESSWHIPKQSGLHEVTVQYWYGGSAAFYVKDFIDAFFTDTKAASGAVKQADGVLPEASTP